MLQRHLGQGNFIRLRDRTVHRVGGRCSRAMSQAEKRAADARRNVLLHVKQTLELLSSLRESMHTFRLVDEGSGANDESVLIIESSLTALNEVSNKMKFIVVRSDVAYMKMKEAYLAMQDVSAYVGQVVKKPSTSSKQIFIEPFRTLATNLQSSILAFVSTVNAVALSNLPNGNVLSMQYQLGLAHLHGLEGRPVNHAAAVDCFQQAAEVGNTEAMVCLARCYIQGQGVDRSEQKGVEWLVRAANSNVCPHAQNELAMLIINNLKESNPFCVKEYCATLVDDSSVVRSLRRSQQQHTAPTTAGHRSGDEYGVEDAIKLLLSAASEGCADAKSSLGAVYEEAGDLEQAASWYEQASSEGCSRGTYLLGHLFLKGRLSASKTRTFALLRQAALGGQTEAYCSLGACYEQGIGVEVNIPLAIESYRRSAALGSKVGMFSLGYLLVENAIEMRKQLKQMRPFLHNSDAAGSHRSLATGGGVVAHTPLDERFAYLSTEAEATLQEGIHWLRAASENHVKDAAFQLGRLYEQAIGVPEDSHAALANYKWAAYLGHIKAAFFAGNLLYAQAVARSPRLFCEAAVYYHQAALGGIVEAMNSYAILLEDGRASEAGLRNLHLAAAWYYQACIERERLEKAHINLAMLLCNTPLSAFRTIQGDIVTLLDAKDFLMLYFEGDAYTDEESREVMLQMVDSIDEHSRSALPLVEEVSQSLASLRRSVRAHDRPRSPAGSKVVAITEDDEEHPVDVKKVPLSVSSSGDRNYSSTTRVVRPFEEAHKLSRGPIQNHGRIYDNSTSDNAPVDGPFASQPSLQDTAPPVHGNMAGSGHYRPGELYTTDGPVVPPSFVPRAVQFNAPSFKPDKPPPHTKPTSRPGPPLPADVPVRAASVPVLTSPRKGQAPPTSHSQSASAKLFESADHRTQGQSQGQNQGQSTGQQYPPAPQPVQRTVSAPSALSAPTQSAEPRTSGAKPKPNKRFSFISGLVHMMSSQEHPHQQQPSEEGKSGHEGSSHGPTAGEDAMRRSVDSTRRPSMWKTLKGAAGVSKSVDASRSPTPHTAAATVPSSSANAQANWGLVAASASSHGPHTTAPAQGVFASEPRPANSPAKPPKPQAAVPQPVSQPAPQPAASPVPQSQLRPASVAYQSQPSSLHVPVSSSSPFPAPHRAATAEPPSEPHDNEPQQSGPVVTHTPAPSLTARPQSQQLPPVVDAASISSAGSRHSAPGPLNSMLVAMKRSAHKKYLTKEEPAQSSPAAQVAATSTGTMDTAASEVDEPLPAGVGERETAVSGPVPMTMPTASGTRGTPGRAHATATVHEDSVVDFADEHRHPQDPRHSISRAYSDYDPVSDLSLSSRDIRY